VGRWEGKRREKEKDESGKEKWEIKKERKETETKTSGKY
jgi:hypothetical protein